jgi:hypothetical protein
MQQPSKRAFTVLSRAPAYATRKHAPGDLMTDRPRRRMEILGYNNTDLSILRAHHPELSPREIAERCGVSENLVRHWLGKKSRHHLPMPVDMFSKLKKSMGEVLT